MNIQDIVVLLNLVRSLSGRGLRGCILLIHIWRILLRQSRIVGVVVLGWQLVAGIRLTHLQHLV